MTADIIQFVPLPLAVRLRDEEGPPLPQMIAQLREQLMSLNVDHYSSCAVNNAPALPVGPCDCGGFVPSQFVAPKTDPA